MPSRPLFLGALAITLVLCGCSVTVEQPNQSDEPASVSVPRETLKKSASNVPATGTGGMLAERLTASGAFELGDAQAPLTLLVITNPYCDYCREFQQEHMRRLLDDFVKQGFLKIQIALLPLQKYPASTFATTSLICATKQSKGLAYADLLFQARPVDRRSVLAQAANADLDVKVLTACIDDTTVTMLAEKQASIARNLGVTLVPTLILNGAKSVGLPEYQELRGSINEVIRE